MDQELQASINEMIDQDAEWKIGDRILTSEERALIRQKLVVTAPTNVSPYVALLDSEKAYREFSDTIPFPVRIWKIQSPQGVQPVSDFILSVLPQEISFVKNLETLIVLKKEGGEADYSAEDICCDLEAQVYQDVSIYISYPVSCLEDLYPAYDALEDLSHISRILHSRTKVYEFEKMMLPSLFYHLNRNSWTAFQRSLLQTEKLHLDQDLLDTAIEFFQNDLNVTETSNRLYIHRNTMLYRLGKIKSMTGYDIRSFSEAVNFYLLYLKSVFVK